MGSGTDPQSSASSDAEVLARVEEKAIADGSTDILDSDVSVPMADAGLIVIVALDTDTTLSLITDLTNGNRIENTLNNGGSLGAGNEWSFSLSVDPQHSYNFQVGAAAQVKKMTVKSVKETVVA